ncbi:MAG: HDOD domain-containing protein [Alkalimonas sp.]|nr:HDOD domain-containing protein [Alkalimonas sp.]
MSAEHTLISILVDKLRHDRLVLPTLPEIALRVRRTADDPEVSLADMAEVISMDPALAARMIRVANSAFLGRTIKVSTLSQAVTRIGLSQIKTIATAMAMEQLFVSQNKQIQQMMDKAWRDTVQVTSIAVACLSYYRSTQRQCALSIDEMTLAALLHHIGLLPILTEAEQHQNAFGHPGFMRHAMVKLSPKIGLAILQAWGFSEMYQRVIANWQKPEHSAQPDYTDFVRIATIVQQSFPVQDQQQALLNHYIEQGVLPDADFMQEPAITAVYQDVRALFA